MGAPLRRKKIVFVMPLHFFGSKSTITCFGERFCDGQYSLVSFLFAVLLLTVAPPRTQTFVKVGARAPVPHGVGTTACLNSIQKHHIKRRMAIWSIQFYIKVVVNTLIEDARLSSSDRLLHKMPSLMCIT